MSEQQGDYKTRKQTIFRTVKNEDNPFVMMDRRPIENPALSWKAKGILAYLLSRPDNWIVRLGDLVKRSPDGVYAVRGAINELKKAGHVSTREIRDENGQFVRYELEVYELPFTSKPLTNFPQAGNPQAENLIINDTDYNENDNTDIGANAPDASSLSIENQIAIGASQVVKPDEEKARRLDFANLLATGMGASAQIARDIAMAFQDARDITLPESKVKAQRKAVKDMIEMGVKAEHVRQATRQLVEREMTVSDLFSVVRTAIDLANKPQVEKEMTRLL